MAATNLLEQQAKMCIGQMVCLALKNGQYYVGMISDVRDGEILLSGTQGAGKISSKSKKKKKAQVSGLMGALFGEGVTSNPSSFSSIGNPAMGAIPGTGGIPAMRGGFAPAPTAPAAAGQPGLFQTIQNSWPTIKMGIGMLQYIWPLMRRFNI